MRIARLLSVMGGGRSASRRGLNLGGMEGGLPNPWGGGVLHREGGRRGDLPNLRGSASRGGSAQPWGVCIWEGSAQPRGVCICGDLGVCPTRGGSAQPWGGLHRGDWGGVYPTRGGLLPGGVCPTQGESALGVCIWGGVCPTTRSANGCGGEDPLPLWTEWHTSVKTLPWVIALWVMAIWEPHPTPPCEQNDRQTRLKTLPSRNVISG